MSIPFNFSFWQPVSGGGSGSVNWEMHVMSVNGATNVMSVYQVQALPSGTGLNDFAGGSAVNPPNDWALGFSSSADQMLGMSTFGGTPISVPSSGATVHIANFTMSNTGTIPTGTLGAGPQGILINDATGLPFMTNTYVYTVGGPAPPGIETWTDGVGTEMVLLLVQLP